jgi:hypothetical protein
MASKRHVREFMFFQILGIIPVMLSFKGEFFYSFLSLLVALLFYRYDSSIRDFCINIKNTSEIFWWQIFLGYLMAGICYLFSWDSKVLSIIWVLVFFTVGMLHAGKVQKFLNERQD